MYNKGIAWHKLSNDVEALQCLTEAARIGPKEVKSWEAMGLIHAEHNAFEKSLECFQKVIELDNTNERAWYFKGASLYRLGRLEEAGEALERAAALGEGRAEALLEDIKKLKRDSTL